MKNKYLAKDDGVLLVDHLFNTADVAKTYINTVYPNLDKSYIDIVNYACLLHDVLKILPNFQEYIKGNIEPENQKYYHNDIGWAFLNSAIDYSKLDISGNFDKVKAKKLITQSIFYHHGNKIKDFGKITTSDILEYANIKNNDSLINEITSFIKDELNLDILKDNFRIDNDVRIPVLFNSNDIEESNYSLDLFLIRNILITADRLSSEYPNKDDMHYSLLINNIINKKNNYQITDEMIKSNINFDFKIYQEQKDIANNLIKFNIIKAPAGFGKTMIGLMSGFRSNKKIVWVCSTKQVVEEVYRSVIDVSENFNLNLNVQSIYTGTIQEQTNEHDTEFESDIIIVNIDTFLSTTYKNNYKLEAIISNGFVIFDEYHENSIKAALFPLTLITMNHRLAFSSEKTILLSATPIPEFERFLINHDYNIFPNKETHYKPRHNKKYKIKFINDFDKIDNTKSTICFPGSIGNTVRNYILNKNTDKDFLQSNFYLEDKKTKTNSIIKTFGVKNPNKPNLKLFTTSILQSSVNISFNNCAEVVISPEKTMQAIGRCNRFGEFDESTIYFIDYLHTDNSKNKKSHMTLVDNMYDFNLSKMWYKYLKTNLTSEDGYTLEELYVFYNNFNIVNQDVLYKLIENKIKENLKRLEKINIFRFSNKINDDENKPIFANSNLLRLTNTECFYITVDEENNYIKEPFTEVIYDDILKTFQIDKNKYFTEKNKKQLITIMEKLTKDENLQYDYSNLLKKLNTKYYGMDDLVNDLGRTNKTPFILNTKDKMYQYYENLGIVKNSWLK